MALLIAIGGLGATTAGQPGSAGTTWHVGADAQGNGSAALPFGTIAAALAVAQPGDSVVLAPGTYDEPIVSVRGGTFDAPLTLRAADPAKRPIVAVSGRVATLTHPWMVVDGLVLDGAFGADDTVRVSSDATGLILRNVEVRRSGRDCVDMNAPAGVLIEDSLIHHCLNAGRGRTDAHGIVAGAARDLTIRRTEVHTFSGDAVQLDPGRRSPGWTNLRIEQCRFWLAPLPAAVRGFAAGIVPGENAIDTKTTREGPRATLTVVDTEAWGFKDGLITHMAAFNIKERVDATFDGVTVHDSEIAFRLRGTADAGARVTVDNTVVHSVKTAVRYENDIDTVRVRHVTVGRDVRQLFEAASAPTTRLDLMNLLVLGGKLPTAAGSDGLAVDASAFRDAAAHDYRLVANSAAVGRGRRVADVTRDRLGIRRPQGANVDVGAYEYCPSPCDERRR